MLLILIQKKLRFLLVFLWCGVILGTISPHTAFAMDTGEDDDASSISSVSSQEAKQKRAAANPLEYTLMLLDRTRVSLDPINDNKASPFLQFVDARVRSGDSNSTFTYNVIEQDSFQCFVCKVRKTLFKRRAEKLIDSFLSFSSEESSHSADESDALEVFSSAMILFPVPDAPDKVLAYLFGRWPFLLNVDTIVKNFGLRTAVSVGIFCSLEDRLKDLSTINQIASEDCRVDDPMNARLRSRRGLHPLGHFRLSAGDAKIEAIRFKPVSPWGKAYITAGDSFQFRMKNCEGDITTLHGRAFEIYRYFQDARDDKMYAPICAYIDTPVNAVLAGELTNLLIMNWSTYFRKKDRNDTTGESEDSDSDLVYPHWTYWFRVNNSKNKWEINNFRGRSDIKSDALLTIKFDHEADAQINLFSVIRTLPIQHQEKYYWFDRGDWFEISEHRIKAMRDELERERRSYEKPFLLPPYDEDRIVSEIETPSSSSEIGIKKEKEKKDYKEINYNRNAVAHIRARLAHDKASWAAFMDTANVALSGPHDKFEFADIVLKVSNHYYIIHVKRAGAQSLGHVCTQAERCGMFLSGNLDRSSLEDAFIRGELNNNTWVIDPQVKKEEPLSFSEGEDFPPEPESLKKFLREAVLKSDTSYHKALKDFVASEYFDAYFWSKHSTSLQRLWNKIIGLDSKDLTQDNLIKIHNVAKDAIYFTSDKVLPGNKRRKMSIVIAIIDDGATHFSLSSKDDEPKTNNIVRLHQTRQSLSDKRLGFLWTVIPKKADVTCKTLRDYSYTSDDVDQLVRLKLSQSLKKSVSEVENEVNIGPKKNPQKVRFLIPSSNIFVVPSFSWTEITKTPESFLAQVLEGITKKSKPKVPFTVVSPHITKEEIWETTIIRFEKDKIILETIESTQAKKKTASKGPPPFREKLIGSKVFKDTVETLYPKALIQYNPSEKRSDRSQEKTPETIVLVDRPEAMFSFNFPFSHASGPSVVENILKIALGKMPVDGERAPIAFNSLKIDHFKLLKGAGKNFETPFEIPGDGRSTPVTISEGSLISSRDTLKDFEDEEKSQHVEDETLENPAIKVGPFKILGQFDLGGKKVNQLQMPGTNHDCAFYGLLTHLKFFNPRSAAVDKLLKNVNRPEIRQLFLTELWDMVAARTLTIPSNKKSLVDAYLSAYGKLPVSEANTTLGVKGQTAEALLRAYPTDDRLTTLRQAYAQMQSMHDAINSWLLSEEAIRAFINDHVSRPFFMIGTTLASHLNDSSTGTMDAIAHVFGLNLRIYQNRQGSLILVHSYDTPGATETVSLLHDGSDHFDRLEPVSATS